MPIEIKEIIIRATVGDGGTGNASGGNAGSQAEGTTAGPDPLQECIEQVFQIMEDKNER
jgi:hypothetical protein